MAITTNIDIFNGKGKGVQQRPGNEKFRKLIFAHKKAYTQAPVKHKSEVSRGIVAALRKFDARFLKYNTETKSYDDIGDKEAVNKTSQALRDRKEIATMGDSNSAPFLNTSCASTEETYHETYNTSMQLLQSLMDEEHQLDQLIVHYFELSDREISSVQISEIENDSYCYSETLSDISERMVTDEEFRETIHEMTDSTSVSDILDLDPDDMLLLAA